MFTYKSTNTLNGKFYIGSTKDFERRKHGHLNSKENYPFQNALRKNPEAFEWEVWEDDCDDPILEQALLDTWFGKECCYNLNPNASHPPSPEGKRMWVSVEGLQTFSHQCPGEGWTQGVNEERRAQNGLAKRGKKESEETRRKKSLAHTGKTRVFSEKHCKNLSLAKKGKPGGSAGGKVAGKLPWWVNEKGENKRSLTKPEGEWQRGRVWKPGKTT